MISFDVLRNLQPWNYKLIMLNLLQLSLHTMMFPLPNSTYQHISKEHNWSYSCHFSFGVHFQLELDVYP